MKTVTFKKSHHLLAALNFLPATTLVSELVHAGVVPSYTFTEKMSGASVGELCKLWDPNLQFRLFQNERQTLKCMFMQAYCGSYCY